MAGEEELYPRGETGPKKKPLHQLSLCMTLGLVKCGFELRTNGVDADMQAFGDFIDLKSRGQEGCNQSLSF